LVAAKASIINTDDSIYSRFARERDATGEIFKDDHARNWNANALVKRPRFIDGPWCRGGGSKGERG